MEFFRMKRDIPFMSWGKYTTTVSLITFLLAVFFLYSKGLNFSVDFTGGTVMEVHTAGQADLTGMRLSLKQLGLHDANVQNFGSSHDVLIRLPLRHGVSSGALSEKVRQALRQQDASLQVRRVEFVGPQVGDELVKDGSAALLFVSLGIVIYLSLRFKWRPAVATLMANLHDVVIILGFFAFFQWEFSLSVLAAVLAILGYSVNESVVVFDRVRENFRKMRGASVSQVIDNAITRTMSRTIITHGCTQLMVTSMLFFGGEALHYFALALTIGILFGIYSSVLVASPIAMALGMTRADFLVSDRKTNTLPDTP
ncbi:protein translocase subunit SecF [Ferrovum myxofaciens]|jgi:preprotein translocase subunit SecF|uniref:Protein-export membrane protein SecF n=2 Tax=root TaxID=1 RepID=A0A8F3IFP3_9PROT|nr:protein-export membrane protein SecF [Ferrovum myxofaciens]MBW8029315.1 protein translocase subunit SecF [Ferrovum sp.]MBU6994476.1 protein translocase subunit SecF [Ferrovum myxofaciens]QKE38349.1 MAG: protein translocase subunit SecF [Ferrovum myxofaciens]QWY76085.1 MAG: protein translocase subunit SecF [Ferrovum myxofaciens]